REFQVGPQPGQRLPALGGALRLPEALLVGAFAGRCQDGGAGGGIQGVAEVDVGAGGPGVDADGLLEVVDGLLRPALLAESNSDVVVSPGELGVDAEGLLEVVDGLVQPAPGTQHTAEVDVGPREVG